VGVSPALLELEVSQFSGLLLWGQMELLDYMVAVAREERVLPLILRVQMA
jgi:hypothetical protein